MYHKGEVKHMFRKATAADIDRIEEIYNEIHTQEETGRAVIGWIRGVYPVRKTTEDAVERDEMFVEEVDGRIVAAAKINQVQDESYFRGTWGTDAPEAEVMVLHTLVVSPSVKGGGYGTAFVDFYERYAMEHGCRYLRMDTNARNASARALYKKLGYREADIVPTVFNGIPGVNLVLLEKTL